MSIIGWALLGSGEEPNPAVEPTCMSGERYSPKATKVNRTIGRRMGRGAKIARTEANADMS